MNKIFSLLIVVAFAVSCKSPKLVPGKPSLKNPKDVATEVVKNSNTAEFSQISATGSYEMAGDKQSFKADIRIIRDSVIWIELSHPVLGIKAGRGILMRDSIAFVNKIERTYMAGSVNHFSEMLRTYIDFDIIQNLLLGEPMREITGKDKMHVELLEKLYGLYIMPKEDPLFLHTVPNYYLEIDPTTFKVQKQEAVDGVRRINANYEDYQTSGDNLFPGSLKMVLAFDNVITLQLKYLSVKTGEPVRVPFNISSKYKRVN